MGLFGFALSAAFLIAPADSRADVKLPALFSSHMVLQQKQSDRIWGWGNPGEEVTVTIADQTKSTKAGENGKWSVTLDPLKAGGPHTLKIAGKNTITFNDVLVGEVWLCAGQSNMEWPVAASNDADLEILSANKPNIRMITVPLVGTQEPRDDFKGSWEVCTPETVKGFSAVGYFFGRQLEETLGVPVGLIDVSWGGSAAEAWVKRDILEKDSLYKPLIERWEGIEKAYPQAKEAFEKALAERKKAKEEGKPEPKLPHNPDGEMFGNSRPGNIYNGVLKPTIGYGIKGAIWYQGESNASRAYQYRDLFPLMIKSWRDEWGVGEFPFYWVQLADFMAEKIDPQDSSWAELREAQTMTLKRLPHTGEAVIIDIGEGQDIHPRNKLDVARRLARWALANDYGVNVPFQSPTYKAMEKKDGKIVITFDHVGGGLKPFDFQEIQGFTIAGGDKKFVWAKAKLVGKDKVEVSAEEVSDPASVRYAWADNPKVNLYSQERLPVTPFRTDDWKGVTADNK